MATSIRDVAKAAGVSAMTVSRVVNGQPGVGAKTRARIEQIIEQLNYVLKRPDGAAVKPRLKTLGLIVPDVSNPFFAPIVSGAEIEARRAGYRLLLCNSENELRLESDYVSDLMAHKVEGLLVAPVGDESIDHLSDLVESGFPMVLLDRTVDKLDCDSVCMDNESGAEQMTEHLIKVGHKKIALVTNANHVSTGRERTKGYRRALERAGIDFNQDLVFHTSTDQIGGYRATQQIFNGKERPTAIFAVNNMLTLGIVQALREKDISVPEDMALVCVDDVLHLAVVSPFLTVIDQPAKAMATVATQLLLERISGLGGLQSRHIVLRGKLVVRSSCGSVQSDPKVNLRSARSTI